MIKASQKVKANQGDSRPTMNAVLAKMMKLDQLKYSKTANGSLLSNFKTLIKNN